VLAAVVLRGELRQQGVWDTAFMHPHTGKPEVFFFWGGGGGGCGLLSCILGRPFAFIPRAPPPPRVSPPPSPLPPPGNLVHLSDSPRFLLAYLSAAHGPLLGLAFFTAAAGCIVAGFLAYQLHLVCAGGWVEGHWMGGWGWGVGLCGGGNSGVTL
jgi:hypothetical protein